MQLGDCTLLIIPKDRHIFQSGRAQHYWYDGRDICTLATPSVASRTATRSAHDGESCTRMLVDASHRKRKLPPLATHSHGLHSQVCCMACITTDPIADAIASHSKPVTPTASYPGTQKKRRYCHFRITCASSTPDLHLRCCCFACSLAVPVPQTIRTLFVRKYDSYSVISDKRNDCIG
jgi:hypothetical protein